MEIADKFEKKWNFPNCVEAVDGKHVVMQAHTITTTKAPIQ